MGRLRALAQRQTGALSCPEVRCGLVGACRLGAVAADIRVASAPGSYQTSAAERPRITPITSNVLEKKSSVDVGSLCTAQVTRICASISFVLIWLLTQWILLYQRIFAAGLGHKVRLGPSSLAVAEGGIVRSSCG